MIIPYEELSALFGEYGLEISSEQYALLEKYISLLLETNRTMNLTRITEPGDIAVKHILDSALLMKYIDIPETAADVGTGAGFPGMVLKILSPGCDMTLIDSLNKRIEFLKAVSAETVPVNCVHIRAEDAGRTMREQFALVTARAVAAFDVLCEYCLPLTCVGGIFAAYKGPGEEIDISAAEKFGGKVQDIHECTLPDGSVRKIIITKKLTPTDKKYPRRKIK